MLFCTQSLQNYFACKFLYSEHIRYTIDSLVVPSKSLGLFRQCYDVASLNNFCHVQLLNGTMVCQHVHRLSVSLIENPDDLTKHNVADDLE